MSDLVNRDAVLKILKDVGQELSFKGIDQSIIALTQAATPEGERALGQVKSLTLSLNLVNAARDAITILPGE